MLVQFLVTVIVSFFLGFLYGAFLFTGDRIPRSEQKARRREFNTGRRIVKAIRRLPSLTLNHEVVVDERYIGGFLIVLKHLRVADELRILVDSQGPTDRQITVVEVGSPSGQPEHYKIDQVAEVIDRADQYRTRLVLL